MEGSKVKIWDCTLFLNEFDLLELRFEEINDAVDKFVVAEGNHTFMGTPKPYNFQQNLTRYQKWGDKITYIIYDVSTGRNYETQWDREEACRNEISEGLIGCADDDLVIIADLDNIPRKESILAAANMFEQNKDIGNYEIVCLEMPLYNYWLNCFTGLHSHECSILRYSLLKTMTPNTALRKYTKIVHDAGWSFSYIGGPEVIIEKIQSYSHAPDLDTPQRKDKEWILKEISIPRDVLGSRRELLFVPVDETFPQTILKNMDKYKKYIKET